MMAGTEGAMRNDLHAQRQFLHRVLRFPGGVPILVRARFYTQQRDTVCAGAQRLDRCVVRLPQFRLDIVIVAVNGVHA